MIKFNTTSNYITYPGKKKNTSLTQIQILKPNFYLTTLHGDAIFFLMVRITKQLL